MKLRSRAVGLGIILTLAALAVACSDPGTQSVGVASASKENGSATTTTLTQEQASLKFAQCMREHGIDVPDPSADGGITIQGGGPGHVDPTGSKFTDAQKTCGKYLDAGGKPKGKMSAAEQDKLLKSAQCLRSKGYDVPDPKFGDGGTVQMRLPKSITPGDTGFAQAQRDCNNQVGLKGPGPGGATSSGPGPAGASKGPSLQIGGGK
jgi:hypothetical protein